MIVIEDGMNRLRDHQQLRLFQQPSLRLQYFLVQCMSGDKCKRNTWQQERLQPREQASFGKKDDVFNFLSSVQTAVDQSLGL